MHTSVEGILLVSLFCVLLVAIAQTPVPLQCVGVLSLIYVFFLEEKGPLRRMRQAGVVIRSCLQLQGQEEVLELEHQQEQIETMEDGEHVDERAEEIKAEKRRKENMRKTMQKMNKDKKKKAEEKGGEVLGVKKVMGVSRVDDGEEPKNQIQGQWMQVRPRRHKRKNKSGEMAQGSKLLSDQVGSDSTLTASGSSVAANIPLPPAVAESSKNTKIASSVAEPGTPEVMKLDGPGPAIDEMQEAKQRSVISTLLDPNRSVAAKPRRARGRSI